MSIFEAIVLRLQAIEFSAFVGGVLTWLTLSFATGAVAQGKGQPASYFLLSLLLSPLIGFLVVLLIEDRRKTAIDSLSARIAALEAAPLASSAPSAPVSAPDGSPEARKESGGIFITLMLAIIGVVLLVAFIAWLGSGSARVL